LGPDRCTLHSRMGVDVGIIIIADTATGITRIIFDDDRVEFQNAQIANTAPRQRAGVTATNR
jgi:hypothetical protein